jgi:hypothetical protein
METMESKRPRTRRAFTDEFKADIVERCLKGDRSVAQVGSNRPRSTPALAATGSRQRRRRSCPSCAGRTAGCAKT